MKLVFRDKNKTGFASYCPSFARAYGCLAEGLYKLRLKQIAMGFNSSDWRSVRSSARAALKLREKGKDISQLKPQLLGTLNNCEYWTVLYSAHALALMNEPQGIARLFSLLMFDDMDVLTLQKNAGIALEEVAKKADAKTAAEIVKRINALVKSDWMAKKAERNTGTYESAIKCCVEVMKIAQSREELWGNVTNEI